MIPEDSGAEALRAFEKERSAEAFESVIRAYMDKVRGVIYNIVLDEPDTDDLVQETFIIAYRSYAKWRADSSFSTWLCGIAVNRTRKFLRRRKWTALEDQHDPGIYRRPDYQAMNRDDFEAVERAMRSLPAHLRIPLVLTAVEGMEGKEAAKACGCSLSALHWRVNKARTKLKEEIDRG